jgi:hypothetical protein
MIEVRVATNAAVEYLKQFFPDANNVQLEEIEISEDERFWTVTLSYEDNDRFGMAYNRQKKYKIFKIDANSGGVLSMKIRELS